MGSGQRSTLQTTNWLGNAIDEPSVPLYGFQTQRGASWSDQRAVGSRKVLDHDSAFANTSAQSSPPAALVVGAGVCVVGPNCNGTGSGLNYLNPLTFYPSTHTQVVTITSGWGSTFDAFASVFAQGGDIGYWVSQVLSDDGLVPSTFPQDSQGNGGDLNFTPATVTSVQVELAPFSFQQTSGGWWVAVGRDGNQPLMNISVNGTQ